MFLWKRDGYRGKENVRSPWSAIDLAGALQKHAGDTISLLGEPFQIVGITRFKSVINRNGVVVPLADLQEVTFRPGGVTFLWVKLAHPEDPAEVDRVSSAIEAIGGSVRIKERGCTSQ
jgi:hypothetical protein